MLNIKNRAVSETLTFDLVDADESPLLGDDGKPCTVTIYGPGSKVFARATHAKSAKLMGKANRVSVNALVEEATRQNTEFLVAITESIELAYDDLQGEEKLRAIYSDTSIGFIADQVLKKAGEWGNFKPGSAKS
jgi:hypothetical protein